VSCGLQDVMEIEALGTPAVLAASSAFAQAADEQTVLLGQPALGRVLVAHPIQDRTDDELRTLARDAVDALLAAVS
jgi:chorismate-pyruvate lyase